MNLETISDLSYEDRIRVLRTLKATGIPIPINLILDHLKHKDRIFAVTQADFEFSFEGHSQHTKDLWASTIFAPIELSDSDSESDTNSETSTSDQLEPTENVTITSPVTIAAKETEDFIPLESKQTTLLSKLKRKYLFDENKLTVKISRSSSRQVSLC